MYVTTVFKRNRCIKKAEPTHEHRAVARQNAEVVPGLAGDSFWLDYRSLGEGTPAYRSLGEGSLDCRSLGEGTPDYRSLGEGSLDYRSHGEGSLDFSCFVLCIKAKNEMGFGAKPRSQIDRTELSHLGQTWLKYVINYL